LHGVGTRVRQVLAKPVYPEPVLMSFASIDSLAGCLIVRNVIEVPEVAFVEGAGAAWSHRFIVAQAERAASTGAGLCILHMHGGRARPALSTVDRENFEALAATLQALYPSLPIASVVLSQTWDASGLVAPAAGNRVRAV